MSVELSEEFNNDVRERLFGVATANDLDELKFIMASNVVDGTNIDDIIWQAGYCNSVDVANELMECFPKANFFSYVDGQFMAAVDSRDLEEMIILLGEGANAFQNDHTALYTPFTKGHDDTLDFLINLGLDPARAFSRDDINELRVLSETSGMDKEDFNRLAFAVATSPSACVFTQIDTSVLPVGNLSMRRYQF